MNGSNMRPVYESGRKQLFHNLGNSNHWSSLTGRYDSNRDGVGSNVYVTSGGKTQYREQNGGYRWSQNFSRARWAGGQYASHVTLVWPTAFPRLADSPEPRVPLKQDVPAQIH
jgi:hypothetical protein